MRALVIDDSRAIRAILRRMLKELGFEVFEAAHGREGMERLSQIGKADLILVDWNMPEMDGLSFIREVRADRAHDSARVVVVTTEAEISRVTEALQAGADEYVMKPFTKDVLQSKLGVLGIP